MVTEIEECLQTLLADKGYDSKSNRQHCIKKGINPVIPLREYTRTRAQERNPNKRYAQKIDKKLYNKRSIIESINSAIKRTLGSYVNNRNSLNQQKQVTIKTIAYNIEHMTRTIKISILLETQ
jgi:IS5 family transposase